MSSFENLTAGAEVDKHQALLGHIEVGIALLQSRQDEEAFSHFAEYRPYGSDANPYGDHVRRAGRSYLERDIHDLYTEDDLVRAARLIAGTNFCADPSAGQGERLKITGCKTSDINASSSLSRIKLAERLKREVAMLAAEEWLHALQYATGQPVAGEIDGEADVLAYFVEKGCEPSLDFITRYGSRMRWYVSHYPGSEAEALNQIAAFQRRYS